MLGARLAGKYHASYFKLFSRISSTHQTNKQHLVLHQSLFVATSKRKKSWIVWHWVPSDRGYRRLTRHFDRI